MVDPVKIVTLLQLSQDLDLLRGYGLISCPSVLSEEGASLLAQMKSDGIAPDYDNYPSALDAMGWPKESQEGVLELLRGLRSGLVEEFLDAHSRN